MCSTLRTVLVKLVHSPTCFVCQAHISSRSFRYSIIRSHAYMSKHKKHFVIWHTFGSASRKLAENEQLKHGITILGPLFKLWLQKRVRIYKIFAFITYNLFRFRLQENTAVGRTSAALRSICPSLSNVSDTVFRNTYYHFEALIDHSYDYFCFRCGHHPPILTWDLSKKGCFPLACK